MGKVGIEENKEKGWQSESEMPEAHGGRGEGSDAQPPTVKITFLDLQTTHDPNIARNRNLGSRVAYFVLAWHFLTGLNGAFLVMVFRIYDYWAFYRE